MLHDRKEMKKYVRLLARYENEFGFIPSYVGILIWWLKKHTADF